MVFVKILRAFLGFGRQKCTRIVNALSSKSRDIHVQENFQKLYKNCQNGQKVVFLLFQVFGIILVHSEAFLSVFF